MEIGEEGKEKAVLNAIARMGNGKRDASCSILLIKKIRQVRFEV